MPLVLAVAAAGQVPFPIRYAVVCRAAGFLLRCTAACCLLFASAALARLLRLLPVAGCGWARTARLLAYACCWGAAPLDEQDTMAVLHWWSLLCGVVTDGDAAVWSTPPPSPLDGARRPSWVAGRLTDPPRRRGGTLMQDHTAARRGASAARARQEALELEAEDQAARPPRVLRPWRAALLASQHILRGGYGTRATGSTRLFATR